MKKILLLFILIGCLTSCNITKKIEKSDTKIIAKSEWLPKTFDEGRKMVR